MFIDAKAVTLSPKRIQLRKNGTIKTSLKHNTVTALPGLYLSGWVGGFDPPAIAHHPLYKLWKTFVSGCSDTSAEIGTVEMQTE